MQTAKRLGAIVLLIGTWLFLFYTLTFYTSLIMTPWDTAITRPDVGTWQHTLNDFFEAGARAARQFGAHFGECGAGTSRPASSSGACISIRGEQSNFWGFVDNRLLRCRHDQQ